MSVKLNKSFVDKVIPTNRDKFYFDEALAGFGMKVTAAGKKVYIVQYRHNGRKRRFTIGPHGAPWSNDAARKEAVKILGLVADGIDPMDKKQALRQELTVSELCDLYLEEGCAKKSPNTIATDKGRIERHIKPLIGSRKLSSVDRATIERVMVDVANGKTATDQKTGKFGRAIVRGGKGTASKVVALISPIYNFAIERGLVDFNPAQGVKKFKENKRERYLKPEEFQVLGELMAGLEDVNPYAIAIFKLLMLTGLRRNEVSTLRWDDLKQEQGLILIENSKTGRKYVPLTTAAWEIFEGVPRVAGNPYIFPGRHGGPYSGFNKIWRDLRKKAGLDDVRLHDLRHSFASVGANGGESLYILGKLLGHNNQATTARYAHIGNNPVMNAADSISSEIADHLNNYQNKE